RGRGPGPVVDLGRPGGRLQPGVLPPRAAVPARAAAGVSAPAGTAAGQEGFGVSAAETQPGDVLLRLRFTPHRLPPEYPPGVDPWRLLARVLKALGRQHGWSALDIIQVAQGGEGPPPEGGEAPSA